MTNTLRSATKKELLDFIADYPADIGKVVGFTDFNDLHNEWLKKIVFGDKDMTLQAHRGSYKTTCLSEGIALMMLFFPTKNIIFMRKTGGDVVEVIRQVSKILKSDAFAYLFKRIYGFDLRFVAESSSAITLNNYDTTRGAAQLLGIGTVGSITGKHSDIVITDDIINLQDRVSRAERDRVRGVYMELQNIRNRGGRIINTGTPWHKDDAFSIMPPAEKYDCYQTGLITPAQIDNLKKQMSPSLFAANYELRHIASEDALFTESPVFFEDQDLLRDGIMHIDAAYEGEDYTAVTIAKKHGEKLYFYGTMERKHVDKMLDKIQALYETHRVTAIYCEDNGDKGYLAKELKRRGLRCKTYHEGMNKYLKISTYLRKWWTNIKWLKGTSVEYLSQIMDYTEDADHDDAPDSAACLCRKLDKGDWSGVL